MDTENNIHQGEVLMVLVKRSKSDRTAIAKLLGVTGNYLSDAYRRPVLTRKMKLAAATVFGVDESVFEHGIGYESLDIEQGRVEEPGEIERLREEVGRLREENARIAEELLRERGLSDSLQAALRVISGK